MLFFVRWLQELGRERKISFYMCSFDLHRRCTTLSTESWCAKYLRPSAYQRAVFLQLHDGMRACVRVDDDEHSGRLDVTLGLQQS